ncbi:hypothetical protein HY11_01630 [Hyphomonas pacifica]|nr:hypothetical protein HY11_01630 [Hyphomonas pacifica]
MIVATYNKWCTLIRQACTNIGRESGPVSVYDYGVNIIKRNFAKLFTFAAELQKTPFHRKVDSIT